MLSTTRHQIHAGLRSLLPNYLARRVEELKALQSALAEQRFDEIRMIGHRLKGSAGTYGFAQLGEVGKQLEDRAEHADAAAIGRLLAELETQIQGIQKEIEVST